MALRIEKIFVLSFLVSCSQCRSFTLKDGLTFISNFLVAEYEDISPSCSSQLNQLRTNLEKPGPQFWGLKMVDASSKVQSGIMSLNIGEMGNFEQCINTKGSLDTGEEVLGKYCLGHLSLGSSEVGNNFDELNKRVMDQILVQMKSSAINNLAVFENKSMVLGPTWAGCFPDGCSTDDINKIVNTFIVTFMDTKVKIIFEDKYCQTEKDANVDLTTGAILTLVFLSSYLAFLGGCTTYDLWSQHKNKEGNPHLVAFSLYRNTRKIFTITENLDHMSCLDGLKVLSMMWVILGHQYSITCSGPITNTMGLIKWADSLHSMFIISGTISVDTFLVIGAFLLTTRFLKEKSENRPIPIHKFYLQRYIRLTPALAAMVLVSSTILMYLGSGPRWPSVKPYFQDNCVDYWWSTLLYVQNYVNVKNMCIGQTWYLSIDMQLFILSPLLLTCLHKWNKKTGWFIVFCAVLCVGLSFYAAWANQLTAILSNPYGDIENYSNKYYLLTHTRATPWFMGVLCGNLVHLYQNKNIDIYNKIWTAPVIWLLCLPILLFCVLIGHHDLRQHTYDRWKNAFHIAMVRPFWAFAICWVIFACVTDKGRISKTVNIILGYKYFQILGRFTYSVYLVHVTMMYLISFARKTPVYFSDFEMIQRFWGSLIFSLLLAFVWVLAFESPFITLEKVFRKKRVIVVPDEQMPSTSGFRESKPTTTSEDEDSGEEIGMVSLHSSREEETPMLEEAKEQIDEKVEEAMPENKS